MWSKRIHDLTFLSSGPYPEYFSSWSGAHRGVEKQDERVEDKKGRREKVIAQPRSTG